MSEEISMKDKIDGLVQYIYVMSEGDLIRTAASGWQWRADDLWHHYIESPSANGEWVLQSLEDLCAEYDEMTCRHYSDNHPEGE